MANPLLSFWVQLRYRREAANRIRSPLQIVSSNQASSTIFLIMRRMRVPLITLIVIFAISIVGLTLIPGIDADGKAARISLFEAFYFMSYTASTIGFGELPYPFTSAQRLWVLVSIYMTVIGWAYAIGTLLTLLQDRAFRQALAFQRFTRKVARLSEPFWLMAGYGGAGELLAKDFDAIGRQIVVIDGSSDRIDSLELGSYHADIPGLVADATNPHHLSVAGLGHPCCVGVLALTNDDQANLAVTIAVALLHPGLPVIARTTSPTITERMRTFGTPTVINPFDRFGDHLQLALHAPSCYRLLTWLEAGPGAKLPELGSPPPDGRWVVCGYGRFGQEITKDLREAGLDVTIIELSHLAPPEPGVIVGDATEQSVLVQADIASAAGLVAGTDSDITNLSILANARRLNPRLFLAARQNQPTSASIFEAMRLDARLVPIEVVAHEVYAQVSTPLLWRVIQEIPARDDQWGAEVISQLRQHCGDELPALWKVKLNNEQAPALRGWLDDGRVVLADLLRSPEDRNRQLRVVPLILLRGAEASLTPDGQTVLARDDELLFAGAGAQRRELESTMVVDSVAAYVLFDRHIPASWIWRKLCGKDIAREPARIASIRLPLVRLPGIEHSACRPRQ
ncbi:MAG: NAD-binding protein [Burkholderiaceae bacterium]